MMYPHNQNTIENIWYAGTQQSWRSSYTWLALRKLQWCLINFWCYCQSHTGHPFLADCLNVLVQVQNKSLNCLAQLGAKQPTRINKNPQGNHHNHTRTAIGAPNNVTICTAPKIRMHTYTTLINNVTSSISLRSTAAIISSLIRGFGDYR